ncbi:hypothetical protein ACP3T3_02000 [Chryseobacterium sp. CBSDS_008]
MQVTVEDDQSNIIRITGNAVCVFRTTMDLK